MKDFLKKMHKKQLKSSGVTLIELLIATGIAAIVMVSVMSTVGNIYFVQKKTRFAQNFYTESRILMERISQFARNNTIDYDRYFLEVGPSSTGCPAFDARQKPNTGTETNDNAGRIKVGGYPSIFYWDTNASGNGTQDRNLGGKKPDGGDDLCAQAFSGGVQRTLYLINGARTLRTAIRNKDDYDSTTDTVNSNAEDYRVEIQRQLGADIDGDLIADIWGPSATSVTVDIDGDGGTETGSIGVDWDTECQLYVDTNSNGVLDTGEKAKAILGDKTSEDFCAKVYGWTSVSPKLMKIDHLTFRPAPDRDPFLNFRIDSAQVHPHVFISLTTNIREPDKFGYESGEQPKMSFQTTVSSRVFGNTR